MIIDESAWIGGRARILSDGKGDGNVIVGVISIVTNDLPEDRVTGRNQERVIRFRC